MMRSALAVEGSRGRGQDRAAVVVEDNDAFIALADGAGGVAGGDAAAELIVAEALHAFRESASHSDPSFWVSLLRDLDRRLVSIGLSTAVIATVSRDRVIGVSVGDSVLWGWRASDSEWVDFTADQRRKPLLGSGEAEPIPFEVPWPGGTVLAASDGLWKFASAHKIAAITLSQPPADAVRALMDSVRLRSGSLPDDVSVVLVQTP